MNAKAKTAERESLRAPMRVPQDRAVAKGRDGKPIWRRATAHDNWHDKIGTLAPDGWTYEWKTNAIDGMPNSSGMAKYAMGGWTPVPASRHAGLFHEESHDGPIINGASILMERPVELTREAREEDHRAAYNQVHHARAKHRLDGAPSDAVNHPRAVGATFIREDITSDTGTRPQYEIE